MNDQAISDEYRQAHREEYQSMLAYRREMLELQRIERALEAQQRVVEQARERAQGAHVDYCEQIERRQEGTGGNIISTERPKNGRRRRTRTTRP
jgi:hypothetical protein